LLEDDVLAEECLPEYSERLSVVVVGIFCILKVQLLVLKIDRVKTV